MMGLQPIIGLEPLEFWLAAGRYLLMVSGFLLGIKHFAWLLRRHDRDHSAWEKFRHQVEMAVGFTVGVLYAMQAGYEPPGVALTRAETVVLVWAFAILLSVLVLSKRDTGVSPSDD